MSPRTREHTLNLRRPALAAFFGLIAVGGCTTVLPHETPPATQPAAPATGAQTLPSPTQPATPPPLTDEATISGLRDLPPGLYVVYARSALNSFDDFSLVAVSLDGATSSVILDKSSFSASLSPDGATIAYIQWPSSLLHLRNVDSGEDRVLHLPADPQSLSWSADGSRLLVGSTDQFWLVEPSKGDVRIALDCMTYGVACSGPTWSPDGEWIAYQLTYEASGPPDPRNGVRIVRSSCLGSDGDCISQAHGPLPPATAYAWSPSADSLAICGLLGSTRRLSVVDAGTWQEHPIGDCAGIGDLVWSPDGVWLAGNQLNRVVTIEVSSGQASQVTIDDQLARVVFWVSIPLPGSAE